MATTLAPITETAGGVTRTERGLSLAGTRITPYDVMDFLQAGWPPLLVRNVLNLNAAQMQAALD